MKRLLGCGEQPVEKVDGGEEAVAEEKQSATAQTFAVGDTVKVGETELIVKSAKLEEAEQYIPSKKGKVLVLEIDGINQGNQSWFLSSADFNLYDKDGQKLEEYFSAQDPAVFGGEVNQGKKISGKIRFDAPEADSYELIYKPDFLTDQEIKFNITPQ